MEETHELTPSRLLSLPRRELQARAKAAGVPANLKSRAIVDALVAQRKTSAPQAAWQSSKDATPAKDAAGRGRPQASSPQPTVDARQGSASLLSLPADMQPLHQLVKSSRDQGLASPVPRLVPRQLPGAFPSPAGTDPSSSPPSLPPVLLAPLGKLAFSPQLPGSSPAGGPPARAIWGASRAGASTLAQLRHGAEDDDDVVQCVDQSMDLGAGAAAWPAAAHDAAPRPPPADVGVPGASYFDASAVHSPLPQPAAASRWKAAPLHAQGPYQEALSGHRQPGGSAAAARAGAGPGAAAAATAAASLTQSLQDLNLFVPLPTMQPPRATAAAAAVRLPALPVQAPALPSGSGPQPRAKPEAGAGPAQLPARFSDQAAAEPSANRQLQPLGAARPGLKPNSSPVPQGPAVGRPQFESSSPQPANSPLGPLMDRATSRQGKASVSPAAAAAGVQGSRPGGGAEAGMGGRQGTGAARQRAAFGMPFQSVDVGAGARAGSSGGQRLAATLTPPRLLGRAASALPAVRDITPRRVVEELKRTTTSSGLASGSGAWLQPRGRGGSRPPAAAAGAGAAGARLPAIAAGAGAGRPAPAAKVDGAGGSRRLSPSEACANPGPGSNKAALASRAVPLMSPLRTPARRVTASEEADGDAAPADTRDAQAYDQLVTRELLLPPASAAAGMSSVIGLTSIKQHLLSLVLPVLAAPPAPPAAAAGGRPRAAAAALPAAAPVATPGEVSWFKPSLLFGPSGVGKTALARALAAEVSAEAAAGGRPASGRSSHWGSGGGTLYVDLHDMLARHAGQSDKVIQAVFRAVRCRSGPMTLVLDKLEAIQSLQRQGDAGQAEAAARLRTALMVGFDDELYCRGQAAARPPAAPLVVVGVAGGGAVSIDDALARCFTAARVYVPLPDIDTREALVFLKMASHEADLNVEDITQLARRTEGFSGSEVQALCDKAVQLSRQHDGQGQAGQQQRQRQPVEMSHFDAALGAAARPALDHAAAVAFFKWKTHLVRLD